MRPEFVSLLPELRAACREPLGLYLHVPFCKDRCTYCSFATTRDLHLKPAVLTRLHEQLPVWGKALGRPSVDTLYLGGGTPSLLTVEELKTLLQAAQAAFDLAPLEEATLEANPGTVDEAWFQGVRGLGFDRLSLGIQTLDDALLAKLGRIHDGAEGLRALRSARRAGFQRLSADLMVGIPGQDLKRILADARALVEAGATHLSIYLLDLDKACPLKAQIEAGHLNLPSDDEVADAFEALQAELPRLGLQPYEISNYAVPGEESRHNSRYWERRPYLGLGPSAASHLGRWRWSEASLLPAWLAGEAPELQSLSPEEALAEWPLLGLRRHLGVDWEALRRRALGENLLPLVEGWEKALAPCYHHGLLVRDENQVRLTAKGMLLSNEVLQVFV
ncbi:MAG: radical SAM family heme chaperone HemW [Firmicutes bacterium]|nr:radical SAM family heme chaperone HemW [Bacillota bacterium]